MGLTWDLLADRVGLSAECIAYVNVLMSKVTREGIKNYS